MEAEQKRKLACDSCKRKKLKCEWDEESICIRCSRNQTECVAQQSHRKKREKKPNTYLSSLEDRLERMESAMMKAALAGARRSSEDMGSQALPDKMSLLRIHDNGTSVFVGSASGFSIFSPQGLNWISEITGNDDFSEVISNIPNLGETLSGIFGPNMWYDLPENEREPLPSREHAASYIDSYFQRGFNTIFPLFDQQKFRERFSRQYPVTCSEDVAWYASLNVLFAISSITYDKGMSPGTPQASSPRSLNVQDAGWWKWFRNASSTFIQLQFLGGSLAAVQAMVGMSFLLQTLPNPYPCSVLSGAALRLAQAIGLHRNMAYIGLAPAEVEERRNVFWIGLVIERGINLRMGRPSVIHEDDIGIDLPKRTGFPDLNYGHLRYMSTMALLQGRIYNKLYSAKSLTKSKFERLQWVGFLDEELQHWRDEIPDEIRPGNEISVDYDEENMIPILMMHFSYFNALTIIHRVSNHRGPWTDKGEDPFNNEIRGSQINPRVFAGGAICVGAARSVIALLECCSNVINAVDLNVIRVVAYYPLAASLTLFANVLQNPRDPQALRDIELMNSVTTFLAGFFDDKESLESKFVMNTFTEVNRLAAQFVNKSRMQSSQALKRGGDDANLHASKLPKTFLGKSPIGDHSMNISERSTDHPRNSLEASNTTPSSLDSQNNQSDINPDVTATPSQLEVQPQQYSEAQQLINDPLKFLDDNEIYGNSNFASMDLDPAWAGMDDLFMPQDGSWFFPISNPLDLGEQA